MDGLCRRYKGEYRVGASQGEALTENRNGPTKNRLFCPLQENPSPKRTKSRPETVRHRAWARARAGDEPSILSVVVSNSFSYTLVCGSKRSRYLAYRRRRCQRSETRQVIWLIEGARLSCSTYGAVIPLGLLSRTSLEQPHPVISGRLPSCPRISR